MFKKLFFTLVCCLTLSQLYAANISKTTDKETNLVGWKLNENNFQLELIQRSPQQTRSFFQGRGFSKKVANNIATQCVLQTIIRNTQAENNEDAITVSLKEWRLTNKENPTRKGLKLKETWDKEWQTEDVSIPSRVAFRWATFPTEQTFEPGGDFNWGMISFGLKPDSYFDLHVFWKQGKKSYDTWIKELHCPADIIE